MHTEVGHRCIGARVNGKLVALESTLDNGDTVEIFTSKAENAGPSRDWLAFVESPRARTKIRQWFAKERREDAIEAGKDALSRAMRKAGLPLQRLLGGDALLTLARDMHLADVSALYAAVGEGHVSAQSVVQKLVAALGGAEGAVEDIAETAIPTRPPAHPARGRRRPRRRGQGRDRRLGQAGALLHAGARRRHPRLRHPRRRRVGAPHATCTNAGDAARASPTGWSRSSGRRRRTRCSWSSIQVEALDRHRLLSDVTRVLSDERVNILSASVTTTRDRVAVSRFTFEMAEPKHLGHLLRDRPQRRGRLRRLPRHRTIGARVNGSLVSLDSKLSNGDVVEIFTSRSPTAAPSQDWLAFVGSSRARTKIRQWFTKERREDAVEAGKEALTRAMRKAGLPLQRLLGGDALARWPRTCATPTSPRSTRRWGRTSVSAVVGGREADHRDGRRRGRGRGHRRDGDPDPARGHPARGRRRPRRRRPRA